ncbi:MAG: hypothetical protein KJO36_05080 [Acidimicrobiia bacterium]|nr:hypothetical protein [Acidimicrobiia bacterium]
MKKRLMRGIALAMLLTALTAAPSFAHINSKATNANQARQGGAPFQGFVGPVEGFLAETGAGSSAYVTAHSGMECGALRSPNIAALGPVANGGIGFDDRFICPSAP